MNTIFRSFVVVSLIGMVIGSVSNLYSDTLYRDHSPGRVYEHYFKLINETDWLAAETIKVFNDDTGQNFRAFCIDHYTFVTEEFGDPLIGQEYNAMALNSPSMTLYTQIQKEALNSFFSHVYSTVYDINGNIIDDANAYFYQLVVWEIAHETNESWDIASGTFGITNAATYTPDHSSSFVDDDYYNTAVSTMNSWFNAITGSITWESIGYGTVTDHELTVYVAEGGTNISQTFISVVSPVTPEPATMLMFGIGLFALPLLRRARKIVTH